MPLLRYFIYVGGALVAFLFVVSYVFPDAQTAATHQDPARPNIRISSDWVGPPRVDLDTSLPTPAVPPAVASMLLRAPAPVREAQARIAAPVQTVAAPIKIEPKVEHKKTKIARRHDRLFDRQLVAAYPPMFQPFRWTW